MWKQLQAHSKREKKKDFRWSKKKLRRRNQHTNHRRRFHPWSQISLFLPYPLHVLFQFFSLSRSVNLSDAWSPHHHHLAAEKQKKKYFSWTRNVFINYCVIVKQQKEKIIWRIFSHFIFHLSVWLYKLNVITKSEHIT